MRTYDPQYDLKYVLNANRIYMIFKIPYFRLMEHSKFVFQGNNLCLDSFLIFSSLVCFVLPVFDPDMRGFLF